MRLEEPMHLDVFDLEKKGRAAAGRPLSRVLASVFTAALLGCASAGAPCGIQQTHASSGHGYALLYETLGQERQASKLLVIKVERAALGTVIDAIAETCSRAYDRLGVLADANPRLDLTDTGGPST